LNLSCSSLSLLASMQDFHLTPLAMSKAMAKNGFGKATMS
jgi:hypothetical protein